MPNCDPGNQTALHLLVARPSAKDIVEKMLRHVDGDDVKMKDKKGNTVLHVAAAAKGIQNIDICKLILSYFLDLIEECNEEGKTALSLFTSGLIEDHYSGDWNTAVDGYDACPELFNVVNLKGETPLFIVAESGTIDNYKILYKHAYPNTIGKPRDDGNTILHCALLHENFEANIIKASKLTDSFIDPEYLQ